MKINIPESIAGGRTAKMIIGVIITIFLGAVGSGLWEVVLGPLLSKFSDLALSAISYNFSWICRYYL